MRVAVTGAAGRLGSALVAALSDAPFTGLAGPIAWDRRAIDLDEPSTLTERVDHDRPDVVVHAAAWTDVDGCAANPELAHRRNALATGVLAAACAARGVDLIAVSTNEVFDGERRDGRGYAPDDAPRPINAYGASKLEGERRARAAYGAGAPGEPFRERASLGRLGIVRTAWLFGPPGADFPTKILAAAARNATAGTPLRVVGDEIGTPTLAADVAEAIVRLIEIDAASGIHHLVNAGTASRADWARELFRRTATDVAIEEVPAATWPRASTPPLWAVLEPTVAEDSEPLRPWTEALAADLPRLATGRAVAR